MKPVYWGLFSISVFIFVAWLLVAFLQKNGQSLQWNMFRAKTGSVVIDERAVPTIGEFIAPTAMPTPVKSVKLLVAGDLMFDRHIRKHAAEKGNDFIFAAIRPLLLSADAVLVNLEGPITDHPSKSLGSQVGSPNNFIFTFPSTLAETLKSHNITIVNLGNNHILNFGQGGVKSTTEYLTAAEIRYFGYVSANHPLVMPSLVAEINDVSIGFVNYNQFSDQHLSEVASLIKELRPSVDFIVVYTHWDNEYQRAPAQVTVNLAHAWVEAGADIIIGSHPHVTQTVEQYQGKYIYYSLGNFIFDQYFESAVKRGLMLELDFTVVDRKITVREHPIDLLPSGQTVPASISPSP
jgi:gamma-polyglutamate biosynthesis protein CapA